MRESADFGERRVGRRSRAPEIAEYSTLPFCSAEPGVLDYASSAPSRVDAVGRSSGGVGPLSGAYRAFAVFYVLDAAPPVAVRDAAPPVAARDAAPSVAARDAAPPVAARGVAPPVAARDAAPPSPDERLPLVAEHVGRLAAGLAGLPSCFGLQRARRRRPRVRGPEGLKLVSTLGFSSKMGSAEAEVRSETSRSLILSRLAANASELFWSCV